MPKIEQEIGSENLAEFLASSTDRGFSRCRVGGGTRLYGDAFIDEFAVCYPDSSKSLQRVTVCYRLHEYPGRYVSSVRQQTLWRWELRWMIRDFGIVFKGE
jgi:hypothetical protein